MVRRRNVDSGFQLLNWTVDYLFGKEEGTLSYKNIQREDLEKQREEMVEGIKPS